MFLLFHCIQVCKKHLFLDIKGHGFGLFITQLQVLFHHIHVTVSVKYQLRKLKLYYVYLVRKMKFRDEGSVYLIKIKYKQLFAGVFFLKHGCLF